MNMSSKISLSTYAPLIIIFLIILIFALLNGWHHGFTITFFMADIMGAFFIIFGFFKVLRLREFAQAFMAYDLIAQRIPLYAYVYPFIELGLGVCYLLRIYMSWINPISFILMAVGALGVRLGLRSKKEFQCACLGTFFNLPLTTVSLIENEFMAGMALLMLLI
jgi:hypothetical protein